MAVKALSYFPDQNKHFYIYADQQTTTWVFASCRTTRRQPQQTVVHCSASTNVGADHEVIPSSGTPWRKMLLPPQAQTLTAKLHITYMKYFSSVGLLLTHSQLFLFIGCMF